MGTMIQAGSDVVSFLKSQHEQIKSQFQRVTTIHGPEREKAFAMLRRLLAVHETAEEEIVHPVARKTLSNGGAIIDKRLAEENAAKKALGELEKLEVDSPDFDKQIKDLQDAVVAHAEAEEREEFAVLGANLDASRLARMRKAVEIAEKVAPTHPHAGVESQAANFLVGPFAAMMDRARDAMAGRH
jgi:hemerythrin superfamily protein